jgi:hypothetical protein
MKLVCSDFLGNWCIERQIEDFLTQQTGTFFGDAIIVARDRDWVYSETGTLSFNNRTPLKSERRYLWSPTAAGFDIHFDDSRFFHSFDLPIEADGGKCSTAHHWCDPDDYNVQYDLNRFPDWSSLWQVTGPRKLYKMISKYKPRPDVG